MPNQVPMNPISSSIIKVKVIEIKKIIQFVTLMIPCTLVAQNNPLLEHSGSIYAGVKSIIINAAERMPEELYDFKPTDEVRNFAEIINHVAESMYFFCSKVLDEKYIPTQINEHTFTKYSLMIALQHACNYCDRANNSIDDKSAVELVLFQGENIPKLGILNTMNLHTIMHYGNMVTYLRMNGLVPPTSDMEFMSQLPKK